MNGIKCLRGARVRERLIRRLSGGMERCRQAVTQHCGRKCAKLCDTF